MRMDLLRIGMKVQHASHGEGIVRSISETGAEIDFGVNRRTVSAADHDLHPGEPVSEGLLEDFGRRWNGGMMTLTPADSSLQSKEVPMETFFHKIVMMRNNLRVLEQKVNAHGGLSDGEKVEMQQYITRCYGSMTTFNVLFKDKDAGF